MDKCTFETQKCQQIFHFDEHKINKIYATLDNGTYYSVGILFLRYMTFYRYLSITS